MAENIGKKKKILVLATDAFSTGGIPRYIRYQVKALKSINQLDKVVVFSLFSGKDKDSFEEFFEVDYGGGGIGLLSKIIFSLKSIITAKKEKVDLVLCNHIGLTPLAMIIQKLFGIPYAVNVYGLEIWSGLQSGEIKGLKTAKAIIGDCKFILQYIKEKFGIEDEKLFLLYDCVDMEKFFSQPVPPEIYSKYGISKDKKIISVIGRLVYDKGQETIIRLLKFLPEDIICVIVGGGPRLEEWKNLAAAEGVSGRAIFTGRVPDEDLLHTYNLADLVVYLSEFKKSEGGGLPLVSIEAAACGKPVLTSNQDGAAEAVSDGFNGFIVSPRDQKAIIEKIKYFFSQPLLIEKMSEQSRQYVRENFSYPGFKEKLVKILEEIM